MDTKMMGKTMRRWKKQANKALAKRGPAVVATLLLAGARRALRQQRRSSRGAAVAVPVVCALGGVGVGAGLMYLLDPDRGASRRADFRRQFESTKEQAAEVVDTAKQRANEVIETTKQRAGEMLDRKAQEASERLQEGRAKVQSSPGRNETTPGPTGTSTPRA